MSDLILREAVEYICRKETVSTNPDEHKYSNQFIDFMDDDAVADFGEWQWANGFNTALVAVEVELAKVPSTEQKHQWIPCSERLPEKGKDVLVTRDYNGREDGNKSCRYVEVASVYGDGDWSSFSDEYKMHPRNHKVIAWKPLPEPYREESDVD